MPNKEFTVGVPSGYDNTSVHARTYAYGKVAKLMQSEGWSSAVVTQKPSKPLENPVPGSLVAECERYDFTATLGEPGMIGIVFSE